MGERASEPGRTGGMQQRAQWEQEPNAVSFQGVEGCLKRHTNVVKSVLVTLDFVASLLSFVASRVSRVKRR